MRRYNILIADDERIERQVLHHTLLEHYGEQCAVSEAENGKQALLLAETIPFDIAILDIEMPGIDGLTAAEELKKMHPGCSLIFLTAFDDFGYAKRAISVRALDYLLKPLNEEELFAVMEEALRLADEAKADERKAEAPRRDDALKIEGGRQAAVAEKMRRYIEENYGKEISMQDAAVYLGYSDAYFCKLFKQTFGKNFITYLADYRIREAKRLLRETSRNVREVSEAVGYTDANYFAKVFKRVTGKSPTEYKHHEA